MNRRNIMKLCGATVFGSALACLHKDKGTTLENEAHLLTTAQQAGDIGNQKPIDNTTDTNINDGQWHEFVFVSPRYDSSKIYVDGQLEIYNVPNPINSNDPHAEYILKCFEWLQDGGFMQIIWYRNIQNIKGRGDKKAAG